MGVNNIGYIYQIRRLIDDMNAGFSVKLEGGQVGFNGPSGLTAGSVGSLTGFSGANLFGIEFQSFQDYSKRQPVRHI